MTIKAYNLHIPIWNYRYNLIIEKDEKKVNKFLGEDFFNSDTNGAFIKNQEYNIIWLRDLKNIPTIAHEVLHMVFDVANSKGLEYSLGSEESYTYLIAFIIDQILNDRGDKESIKF